MKVKLVVFDLDDTLAASKSAIEPAMADCLNRLSRYVPICIISGGGYPQFYKQVLAKLPQDMNLDSLHLMPTCGTRYFKYVDGDWNQLYVHDLSEELKVKAFASIEKRAKELNLWEPDDVVAGDRIEDRGSQITFSALGQEAKVDDKKSWDSDGAKRESLRELVSLDLPELDVRIGGSTSIDITSQGIDKAFGVKQLSDITGVGLAEMLFIGDKLEPGGNDYPVKELGVKCHQVSGPGETIKYLNELMAEWDNN